MNFSGKNEKKNSEKFPKNVSLFLIFFLNLKKNLNLFFIFPIFVVAILSYLAAILKLI
jgi:hypothetical protein